MIFCFTTVARDLKVCLHVTFFSPLSFYCHENNGEKMGPSPILSIIHTVTIGTMLNNSSNVHGLKTLHVNKPELILWWFQISEIIDRLNHSQGALDIFQGVDLFCLVWNCFCLSFSSL